MFIEFDPKQIDPEKNFIFDIENVLCIVDKDQEKYVTNYIWHLRFIKGHAYAYRYARVGKRKTKVFMHREIANCPRQMLTHHKNLYSLDNRRKNLVNWTWEKHKKYHATT